ncbi:outer membrane protein [Oceaniferula spumae]
MKTTILTIAAGGMLSALATAGEPVAYQPAPTPEPTWNWTGFYAGVQGGINFDTDNDGGLEFDSNLDGNYGDTVPFGADDGGAFRRNFEHEFHEAVSYGIHVGYDHQLNSKWVLGGVIDYNWTHLEESQSGFSATPAFYREERSLDNFGSARLRAGYLVTDRTLVFLTGGLAYGEVDFEFDSNNLSRTSSGGQDSDWGYVLGAGVETRLTPNWSLTFEYLYTNLGDGDFTTNFTNGPFAAEAGSTNARGSEDDFDFHTIQLKLSYRF